MGVYDPELGKTPFTLEVLRQDAFHEPKHALGVAGGLVLHLAVGVGVLALRVLLLLQLFLRLRGQMHVGPHLENVDGTLVRGARDVLRNWVESQAVDVCVVRAAPQLLDLSS